MSFDPINHASFLTNGCMGILIADNILGNVTEVQELEMDLDIPELEMDIVMPKLEADCLITCLTE